ncbi:MAG: RHS repeat-associated core domain-containing protein [Candidatus Acidiferrales bacterium]
MAEAYTATSSTGTKITDLGYSYSVRGEISAVYESTPHSGGYYSMSATYWPNGALDTIGGLPTLPTLTYTPDGEGRPAIVTASAGQNPVSSTTYNPASLPTSMILSSTDSDSFTFDPNTDRMTQFQFNVNSQSLTGTIGWNPLGTPSSLDITDAFNSTDTQNCSFAHDDLTRLATVNCGTIWGQSFTYDAFGNITKTVLSGSSGTSFQPTYANPSTNRIASLPSFTPTYDANGNLTKDPQHQYGWDSDGRPVTIDSVTLTYDALHRMVEQNNAGTYTQIVYDPLGEKFGLMNAQTLQKAFAPLPDGGIAAYTSSGLAYYRHPDWLGSSRLASTTTQGIYSDTAYAPFGEPYAQSGTADPSFTGQNQDTASNLYDFLFREDSSIQGRWISPDPAGLAAVNLTDPQSWNRYAYVRNSPGLLVDPLGLDDCDPTVIIPPGYPPPICVTSDQGCVITACGGGGGRKAGFPLIFGQGITGGSVYPSGGGFHFQLFPSSLRLPGESFSACVNRVQQALLGNTGQAVLNDATGASTVTSFFTQPVGTTTAFASAGTIPGTNVVQGVLETVPNPQTSFIGKLASIGRAEGATTSSTAAEITGAAGFLGKVSGIITAVGLGLEGAFAISCR